jgi:cyclin T
MVALTCLFLAAKTEDEPRKLRKVAEKFHTKLQENQKKTPVQLLNEKNYFTYKSKVCIYERIVLQTLSFDLNVVHPHTIMIKMCKQLTKAPAFSSVKPRDFAQHAFNFLNDSGRTTVGVVYSPSTLAASAVYFAFKYFEIQDIAKRTSKKVKGKAEKEETEYQKEMRENAADIRDVCLQVMQMYLRDPKIKSVKSKHENMMRIKGKIETDMRESEKNSTSLKVETKTTTVSSSMKKENGNHMKREAESKIEHTNESPRKQRRVE